MEKWENMKKHENWENFKNDKKRLQNHARNDRGEILSIFHTGRHRIRQILENPIFGSKCQKNRRPKTMLETTAAKF